MEAKQGDTVRVTFTGKLDDGTIVDTSEDCGCEDCDCEEGPLEFTIGEEEMIPGLEEAIIGMKPGEKKTVRLTAEQAYGQHDDDLVMEVEREQIPESIFPEVGQILELTDDETGDAFPVTVTEVTDEKVVMDANHPLSGKDITYDVELIDIG